MRFYTESHQHYCGIDLHAKTMYLCILDSEGQVLLHQNVKSRPEAFLAAVASYREDLVVAAECIFTWYWLADLCRKEGIAFVGPGPVRAGPGVVHRQVGLQALRLEGGDTLDLLDLNLWKQVSRGQDWRDVLARTRDEEASETAALRQATRTGRPLGSEGFVKRLEATFGRKLNAKRTGRPKKTQAVAAGEKW